MFWGISVLGGANGDRTTLVILRVLLSFSAIRLPYASTTQGAGEDRMRCEATSGTH